MRKTNPKQALLPVPSVPIHSASFKGTMGLIKLKQELTVKGKTEATSIDILLRRDKQGLNCTKTTNITDPIARTEKTKAKTALDEKEKKRTEASNLVAATEAAIKKAMQDTEAAEKLATTSKETLVTATTQGDALAKELEAETVLLTKANAEVEKLKAELASVNEKLKQAQTISQQIQNKVDEKKAGLTKATQQAAAAQIQIDTATKMMNDAKAEFSK